MSVYNRIVYIQSSSRSGRENLPEFLATAKELEVKGLMEANDDPSGLEENGLKSPLNEVGPNIVNFYLFIRPWFDHCLPLFKMRNHAMILNFRLTIVLADSFASA